MERIFSCRHHFMRSLGWGCCLVIGLMMAPDLLFFLSALPAAQAAEDHREYDFDIAKGMFFYNQGRYADAERHLRNALDAKPGDRTAGYYLGLTSIRLQRYSVAEERLREVLRRRPDDARAHMGLGMALYYQERYPEASAELSTAERTLKDDPLLYYYAGLAAASNHEYQLASSRFLHAGKLDPVLANNAHYLRGAVLHSQSQFQEATKEFSTAIEGSAGAVATAPSPRAAMAPSAQSPSKRWNANFGLSTQYDSNVVLLPGGSALPGGISHKDDFVTALTGNYEYRFFQDAAWTMGAGGGLYTNFHARLSDFNVLDFAPTLFVQRQLGWAQLRIQYILDYVTIGGDSYLLSNALQPTLTIPQSDSSYTQAFFRYQNKDFKSFRDDQLGVPVNQTRDANNFMLGAMQYWRFPDDRGYVRAGYTFDTDVTGGEEAGPGRPTSADWSYTGHRLSTGIAYQPFEATTLQFALDYYRQNYNNANSFSPDGAVRKDNVYQLTGTAVRDLRSWLWLAFQYSFTRDQSNVEVFDYTRHVVSLTLGGAF